MLLTRSVLLFLCSLRLHNVWVRRKSVRILFGITSWELYEAKAQGLFWVHLAPHHSDHSSIKSHYFTPTPSNTKIQTHMLDIIPKLFLKALPRCANPLYSSNGKSFLEKIKSPWKYFDFKSTSVIFFHPWIWWAAELTQFHIWLWDSTTDSIKINRPGYNIPHARARE